METLRLTVGVGDAGRICSAPQPQSQGWRLLRASHSLRQHNCHGVRVTPAALSRRRQDPLGPPASSSAKTTSNHPPKQVLVPPEMPPTPMRAGAPQQH